jgi:hypothetical protein
MPMSPRLARETETSELEAPHSVQMTCGPANRNWLLNIGTKNSSMPSTPARQVMLIDHALKSNSASFGLWYITVKIA